MVQKYHDYEVREANLDDKDKRILRLLNQNARMNLTTISKKTGIPIDTVRYRISQMQKNDVFKYAVIINPLKLGYPIFNALYLQLINFSQEEENELVAYVKSHPYLVYAAKLSGKYDFAIGLMAKNMKQFDAISNEVKSKFQHLIKDVDTLLVIEEFKYDYLVDLIN